MSLFASRISGNPWVMPVSVMSLVLGFMIALAWVTPANHASRVGLLGASQQERVSSLPVDDQALYQKTVMEVAKLQKEITRLQNAIATQSGMTKALNDSLQDVKIQAALTDLEGPGLLVTLRDSSKPKMGLADEQNIHDTDVLRVVNELWNAGAEAISVNNHRVATGTSFRCVGSVILVDNVHIASPINIRAIGDAATLTGALSLRGGILDEIRGSDPSMVSVEEIKNMRLPAYTGSTTKRIGKVPKEVK